MYEYPEELGKVPEEVVWSVMLTNIGAVTMMTRCLVNDMIQRKKGIIVNVSSGAALQPIPLAAVYAASKVYKCFMLCRFMQTVFFLRKIETKPFLTHLNADIHQELLFSYPR